MHLLLDESVHLQAPARLRELGIDACHILELGMGGLSDEQVLAMAVDLKAVLVCHDSDFHKILASTGATRPSVIRVRAQIVDPNQLAELLFATCTNFADLIRDGAAISVDTEVARGRRLPLR